MPEAQQPAPAAPSAKKPSLLKKIGLGALRVVLYPLSIVIGADQDG